jgi:hypothetical protein
MRIRVDFFGEKWRSGQQGDDFHEDFDEQGDMILHIVVV